MTGDHFLLGVFLVWALTACLRLRADWASRQARLRHAALLGAAMLVGLSASTQLFEPLLPIGFMGCISLALYDLFSAERTVRRFPRAALSFLAAAIAVPVLFSVPTAYDYVAPASVHPIDRMVKVQGGKPSGQILGLTVTSQTASPVIHLVSTFSPEVSLQEPNAQAGYAEARESYIATSSQRSDLIAPAVALQYLGLGKGIAPTGKGAVATWVEPSGPAAGQIQIGDLITAINGQPVTGAETFLSLVGQVAPGAPVKVGLVREEQPMEVTVTLAARQDAPERGFMGVAPEDDLQADIPLTVSVDRSVVSGPSWGAVLALSLVDQLTPGGVTYGNLVAGTGTLKADGTIGEIGGIAQKAWLAEQAGADVLFVPASQAEAAGRLVNQIQIVPVERLDDMITWLKAHPKT